jgi:hypothetical protein
MRIQSARLLVISFAFVLLHCANESSSTSTTPNTGGTLGSGGNSATAVGGNNTSGSTVLSSTGGVAAGGVATGGTSTSSATTVPAEAFELEGSWLFLGPGDLMHTIQIANGSMVYTDVDEAWSSNYTITKYDNDLDQFQITFESGTGTYYPVEQTMSGTYVVNGAILTIQLAKGLESYPPLLSPGSCTDESSNRIADCGLYMTQM